MEDSDYNSLLSFFCSTSTRIEFWELFLFMSLNIVKENTLGFCIENISPYDTGKGKCSCYKTFIPYTVLGRCGVIYVCRNWVNYLMLNGCKEEVLSYVREKIQEHILNKYPILNDNRVGFSRFGYGFSYKSIAISQQVCPQPFSFYINIEPSFFLQYYAMEGRSVYYIENYYDREISGKGLHNLCVRQMVNIGIDNIRNIDMWITRKKEIKKHSKLVEEIINHINKIENENN